MKLLLVPPYRGAGYDYRPDHEPYYQRALEQMRADGELDGIDVEIDGGAHSDHRGASRDEDVFDHIAVATLDRVKAITAHGGHDAVIVLGGLDFAFHALRLVSPIPVVHPVHATVHIASLVADRFSWIDVTDPQAARVRRLAKAYGFDDKLASVRWYGNSSTGLSPLLRAPDPLREPQVTDVVEQLLAACVAAIELDRAELLVIPFTPMQQLKDYIRRRLDDVGYHEIPVVWILSASVAVARSLVDLKLLPARRAHPSDALLAKPSFR